MLQFLENYLKIDEQKRKEFKLSEDNPFTRRSNETYKMLDEDFVIKDKKCDLIQYATFYWLRLQSIKPFVKENAEITWVDDHRYVTNILDIKPFQSTVIIGTLFKE